MSEQERLARELGLAADRGEPVRLEAFDKRERPTLVQEIRRPPVRKPRLVRTSAPSE